MQRRLLNTSIAQIKKRNAALSFPGKRAVVVGGTSGIGEGIAMRLAKANVSVTIVGRNAKGHEIVKKLQAAGTGQHEFISCDSFHMKNVVGVSNEIKAKYPKVDYLGRTETSEGIDQKLALHYFSRMAFTRELLPSLRQGDGGKVLSVFSGGVHSSYAHVEEDFELKHKYTLKNAADAGGFYNDLALDSLSKQKGNEGILFVHAAPGAVSTNWGTEMPWGIRIVLRGLQKMPFFRTAEDCGEAMCVPLFEMNEGGFMVMDQLGNEGKVTDAHSQQAAELVWKKTIEVLDRAVGK